MKKKENHALIVLFLSFVYRIQNSISFDTINTVIKNQNSLPLLLECM